MLVFTVLQLRFSFTETRLFAEASIRLAETSLRYVLTALKLRFQVAFSG